MKYALPFLLLLPTAAMSQANKLTDLLEKKVYTDAQGKTLAYRLLKPENYDSKTVYPLVIFLHGAGERGSDNTKQLIHGVSEFAKPENRKAYPCFLLAPQCPDGKRWVEVDWGADKHTQPKNPSDPMKLLLELIPEFQKEYRVDPKCIYVTGLSMGGFGTWDLVAQA